MPELKKSYRFLLYICMFSFSGLSIATLFIEGLPFIINIAFYCIAMISIVLGIFYFVRDTKYLIQYIISPRIRENPYTGKVVEDYRLRTVLFVLPGTMLNILFAVFNGVVAILSASAWLGTLAAYYIVLSFMRMGAVFRAKHIETMKADLRRSKEIEIYKRNSVMFIVMAVIMIGMVILLINQEGGKQYPGIMIYVVALYAFLKIIMAIINVIKVNRENSPLLTIIRRIGYLDACVSIFTLQTAMFASFGTGEMENLMNGLTGGTVCLTTLSLGIYGMIIAKRLQEKEESEKRK